MQAHSPVQEPFCCLQLQPGCLFPLKTLMNSYILITQPVYEDIHPNLITVPLQTDVSMPYGLVYAKEPTAAAAKFIRAVKKIVRQD